LSVTPDVTARAIETPRDVIILLDTSASQTGDFRENALAAVEACVAKLGPQDRVQLMAVDLEAREMTSQFVAPDSSEIRAAIDRLKLESPLGSTDMEQVLVAATSKFDPARLRGRNVLYIGDGMSQANLLGSESFGKLIESLANAQISVSSYAVGPQCDARLLAALANYTGGNIYVAEPIVAANDKGITEARFAEENVRRGAEAGAKLASWVRAGVFWPDAKAFPAEMGDVYPRTLPPLRTDRDTVVVGAVKDSLPGELKLTIRAQGDSGKVDMSWSTAPKAGGASYAYLPQIVETASWDGGLSLPTVGTPGLVETGRMLAAELEGMTKLAENAVAMGDANAAQLAANAVLLRDPENVRARTVQQAAEKRTIDAIPVAQTIAAPAEQPVLEQPANDPNSLMLVRPVQNAPAPPAPAAVNQPMPAPGALTDQLAPSGAFLDLSENRRSVIAQMMRREVENAIVSGRRRMSTEPDRVMQELKLALQNVERAPDLAASVRTQLIDRLQAALRETQRAAQIKDELDAERQAQLATARQNQLAQERLMRDIDREKQLIERVSTLVELREWAEAEDVAQVVADLDPFSPTERVTVLSTRLHRQDYLTQFARAGRWRYFVEALQQVELSSIPYPDDPPIIYPDAEVWRQLTARRKDRYGSMDLRAQGETEERIERALQGPLHARGFDFTDTTLEQVVAEIANEYSIPVEIDNLALEDAGLGPDEPVTMNLHNVSLRSALNHLLRRFDLTYIIKDEVLLITTPEVADENLTVKVYPVADLVIPIQSGGGFGGGFGGGGFGGGGFGGGGFGGGGFGGGGFGGGGFGGGGIGGGGFGGLGVFGGGGGFFSVPAENSDAAGSSNTQSKPPATNSKASASPSQKNASVKSVRPISLDDKLNPEAAWNNYFARNAADSAAVRETVRQKMGAKQYDQVIALVHGALRNGQSQPWMYETLGIAMELGGRPKAQIERAVMSAIDFSASTDELMYVGQYLTRIGLDRRAVQVYKQVAKLEPLRGEAYALAMRAAQQSKDLAGIEWATVGVLRQAWPKDQAAIETTARRVARATLELLKREGKTAEHDAYLARLNEAVVRDVVVQVSWTGPADIDIAVEEPAGSVCSSVQPRTLAGGVALGDDYIANDESNGLAIETYVCPEGFTGEYKVRIHRVWGEVAAGKVTVDVFRHVFSGEPERERRQIEVGEKDAVVVFTLDEGRRQDNLEAAQLAGVAKRQQQIATSVLAQQISDSSDSSALPVRPFDPSFQLARALVGRGGGAVGFMPQIQVLPEGTQFLASGVVSADRRYVRITASPNFSSIAEVTTFTFAGPGETVEGQDDMMMDDDEEQPDGPLNLGGGGFGGR
jgi:hypothetical protein